MVVDNLHVRRPGRAVSPLEANSPLVINGDAVLPFPVSFQRLKTITWQRPLDLAEWQQPPGGQAWDARVARCQRGFWPVCPARDFWSAGRSNRGSQLSIWLVMRYV